MELIFTIKNFKSHKKVLDSFFQYSDAYEINFQEKKYYIETFLMI